MRIRVQIPSLDARVNICHHRDLTAKWEEETGESLEISGLDSLSVILRLLFLVIKHHEQTTQGGNSLFHIIEFHRLVRHQGKSGQEYKQGKNLEAGTEAWAMEESR